MSEIESKEETSIISSTRLRTCTNAAADSSADTIEESLTSSNSDEYMDEEVDGSGEDGSEDESEEDESEADDEDEEMEEDANRPGRSSAIVTSSSPHNTRSKSASPKKNGTKRDTKKSTNGTKKTSRKKKKEGSDALPMGADSESDPVVPSTYIPSADDGFTPDDLDYDESAYIMYHKAECGYPCLSFDIIPDGLGTGETRSNDYPQSVYLVAGTQAPKVHANKLLVMKMSNLHRMKEKKKKDQEEESDSDDDDKDESDPAEEPHLLAAQVPHDGSVNRVRVVKLGNRTVAATWSELGHVFLWDLSKQLTVVEECKSTETFNKGRAPPKHFYKFSGHKVEGYAMDWSPMAQGFLATGDCNKNIHIWKPEESFSWKVDSNPLIGHTSSVEDIQWSPTEPTVLASCSVDKSIRIFDIRSKPSSACMITAREAHSTDINVISWNRKDSTFLLSGGDDGAIKTWDLRMFAKVTKNATTTPAPIAMFRHHVQPVTSIEWHPNDSTVFAASSDDNQITLWDLAVEKDDEEEEEEENEEMKASSSHHGDDKSLGGTSSKENSPQDGRLNQLPPQLLFIHQGQNEVKEVHWHPQIDGLLISTALSGFDIFRTVSV